MPMGDPGAGRGQAFVQEWAHSERCRKVRQPTAFDSPGQTHNLAQHTTDVWYCSTGQGNECSDP